LSFGFFVDGWVAGFGWAAGAGEVAAEVEDGFQAAGASPGAEAPAGATYGADADGCSQHVPSRWRGSAVSAKRPKSRVAAPSFPLSGDAQSLASRRGGALRAGPYGCDSLSPGPLRLLRGDGPDRGDALRVRREGASCSRGADGAGCRLPSRCHHWSTPSGYATRAGDRRSISPTGANHFVRHRPRSGR
jgi:hypothetical protein